MMGLIIALSVGNIAMSKKFSDQFISCIHDEISYWESQNNKNCREKMEGLAFSILCMLDGVHGNFSGNIGELASEMEFLMIHEKLYKKEK